MNQFKFRRRKLHPEKDFTALFNIGRAIREIRTEKGMSLGDVFRITGIDRSSLSNLETGKIKCPRLITILDIAAALKVKPRDIIQRAVVGEPEEVSE